MNRQTQTPDTELEQQNPDTEAAQHTAAESDNPQPSAADPEPQPTESYNPAPQPETIKFDPEPQPDTPIYTRQQMQQLTDQAYLRGRNEAIDAQIRTDTTTPLADDNTTDNDEIEIFKPFRVSVWRL